MIIPLWLSRSLRSFLYSSSVYSCYLFLISSASFTSIHTISVLCRAHLCMKCSLRISNFLEEISAAAKSLQSCPTLHDLMDCTYQAPSSMGFSRQEYWSGVPSPSPEEIFSLSYSVVFLYFFALIAEEGFISSCYSLELCIQMLISFLFSFAFCFSSFHSCSLQLKNLFIWQLPRHNIQFTSKRYKQIIYNDSHLMSTF